MRLFIYSFLLPAALLAQTPVLVDGPVVGGISRSTAVVSWSTDIPAYSSGVKWGLSPSTMNTVSDQGYLEYYSTLHSAPIQGTPANSTIYYQVCSTSVPGSVQLTITNPGAGYTQPPMVALSGSGAYAGVVSVVSGSSTVTWVSGDPFSGSWVGSSILIGNAQYIVMSVSNGTTLGLNPYQPYSGPSGTTGYAVNQPAPSAADISNGSVVLAATSYIGGFFSAAPTVVVAPMPGDNPTSAATVTAALITTYNGTCLPSTPLTYTSGPATASIPAPPASPATVDTPVEPTGTVWTVGASSHDCNSPVDGLVAQWTAAIADNNPNGEIVEIDPTLTPYCASFDPYVFPAGHTGASTYILTRAKNSDAIWPAKRRVNPGCANSFAYTNLECQGASPNKVSDYPQMARIIHTAPNMVYSSMNGTGDPTAIGFCYPGTYYWWQWQSTTWSASTQALYRCNDLGAGQQRSITSIPSAGTLIITVPNHGFTNGQFIHVQGVTGAGASAVNGDWSAVVVDANTVILSVLPGNYCPGCGVAGGSASGGTAAAAVYQKVPYTSLSTASAPSSCTLGTWYHVDGTFTPNPDQYHRLYYGSANPYTGVCEAMPVRFDAGINAQYSVDFQPQAPLDLGSNNPDHLMFQGISFEPMYLQADPQTLQFIPSNAINTRTGTEYWSFIGTNWTSNHLYFDNLLGGCNDPFSSVDGTYYTAVRCAGPLLNNLGSNWHVGGSYFYGFQMYGGLSSENDDDASIIYPQQASIAEIVNNHFDGAGILVYFNADDTTLTMANDITVSRNEFVRPDKFWTTTGSQNFLTSQGVVIPQRHALEFKHVDRASVTGNTFTGGWVYNNSAAAICICPRVQSEQATVNSTATVSVDSTYMMNSLPAGASIAFNNLQGACQYTTIMNHLYTVASVNLSAMQFTLTQPIPCTGALNVQQMNSHDQALSDILIANNTIMHSPEGIDLHGTSTYVGPPYDTVGPTLQRVQISNNLFAGIDGCRIGQGSEWYPNLSAPSGNIFELGGGAEDLQFIHNTAVGRTQNCERSQVLSFAYACTANEGCSSVTPAAEGSGLTIRDNIAEWLPNGADFMEDQGTLLGKALLDFEWGYSGSPGYNWAQNVILRIGGGGNGMQSYDPSMAPWGPYPNGTLWFDGTFNGAASTTAFPFYNVAQNNYRLKSSSPFCSGCANRASDGTDIGVDPDALGAAQGIVSNVRVYNIGAGTATVGFLAPDTYGCPVDWSTDPLFGTYTRVAASGGARLQNVALSGLPAHTAVSYRVQCQAQQPVGVFSMP